MFFESPLRRPVLIGVPLPSILFDLQVLGRAALENAELLPEEVLAPEEVLPLAVEPLLGVRQGLLERVLTGDLVWGETRRCRLQRLDIDDAAVQGAPLGHGVPEAGSGVLLLQVAQPVSQTLVLLGELRKVGNLRRLVLGRLSGGAAGYLNWADLAHLEVLPGLTALRLPEHGRLLLAEHLRSPGGVSRCKFARNRRISDDRAAVLPHGRSAAPLTLAGAALATTRRGARPSLIE